MAKLYCPANKHEMIKVASALWLCQCSATGDSKNLKGIVDEARAMVMSNGGFDAVIQREKEARKARRKVLLEERNNRREKLDQYGYYRAWTVDDWYFNATGI